jgi:hypothetical protein
VRTAGEQDSTSMRMNWHWLGERDGDGSTEIKVGAKKGIHRPTPPSSRRLWRQ